MTLIRTLLGDIPPQELGLTLSHDHIFARPPADVADPDLRLDDPDASRRELENFAAVGGGAVIEMTTVDYGRDGPAMAGASRASGVHLIAATGFNKAKFAERHSAVMTTEAIAEWMTREVQEGLQEGGGRAGVIKASSSLNGPTPHERRVFEAAVEAQRRSGAPVSTHTEKGSWALEQVQLLTAGGVPPGRIMIGHLDLNPQLDALLAVAETGVYLSLDQFSKEKYLPDAERIELVAALVRRGHGRQLMLGGDLARRSYWTAYGGGPGYRHIPTTIRARLEQQLSAEEVRALLYDNPARFLSWVAG